MKKTHLILILLLLMITGCSSYVPSNTDISNSEKIKGINAWNISYDSSSGYAKSNSLIINEIQYTDYSNPNSASVSPNPSYEYSEVRGKNITGIIKENLSDKGLKLSGNAEGKIVISRPTFFDKGRYILHTVVNVYDKDDNELARLDIFNNCIQRNLQKGIYYATAGDVMNDRLYAVSSADKIFKMLEQ